MKQKIAKLILGVFAVLLIAGLLELKRCNDVELHNRNIAVKILKSGVCDEVSFTDKMYFENITVVYTLDDNGRLCTEYK